MSRYEAKQYPFSGKWEVVGITNPGRLTEAEASIIAFALNAVAEGKALLWLDQEEADRLGRLIHPYLWTRYTGPTEGVKP